MLNFIPFCMKAGLPFVYKCNLEFFSVICSDFKTSGDHYFLSAYTS